MQRNWFPRHQILPDGRQIVIVNELCNCTHFRTQHDGTFGSGYCGQSPCGCGQFTWKCFVLGGLSEVNDQWIAHIRPSAGESFVEEMQEELDRAERDVSHYQNELAICEKERLGLEERLKEMRSIEKKLNDDVVMLNNKTACLSNEVAELYGRLSSFLQPYRRIVAGRARSILLDDP